MAHGNPRVLVVVVVAVLLSSLPFVAAPSRAEEGSARGEGTCFEVTNSTYLNVTLCSTEVVNVTLESVPSVVSFTIRSVGNATSTSITLSGLAPNATYFRYQDGHLIGNLTADEAGNFSYAQDLSTHHHVFITEEHSTKYIRDAPDGGDCTLIGTWDGATKTCTLTANVYETIILDSDGLTLDGNGKAISGYVAYGVYASSRSGLTVKNLVVTSPSYGVYLYYSSGSTVRGNSMSGAYYGIYLYYSSGSTVRGNSMDGAYGIYVDSSGSSTVSENTISALYYGIILHYSSDTAISGNAVTVSGSNAVAIYLYYVTSITMADNVMNRGGIRIEGNAVSYWNTHSIDGTNTVGGKPVRYCKNTSGGTIPTGAGQVILASCSNIVVEDQSVANVYMGFADLYGSGNTLRTSTVASTGYYGVYVYSSGSSTVSGNSVTGSIYFVSSGRSTVSGNSIAGSGGSGIILDSSGGSTVSGNTAAGSISLGSSSGSTVSGNAITGTISLYSSGSSTVSGNTVSMSSYYSDGIGVRSSDGSTVDGNNVWVGGFGSNGIRVSVSSGTTVSGNTVSANSYGIGIFVDGAVTISGNTVSGGGIGISVASSGSTVSGNTVSGAFTGISLSSLSGVPVSGNAVSTTGQNPMDIRLASSTNVALSGNVMNGGGIVIEGTSSSYWNAHTIDATNTVGGKPVRYCKNTSGGTIAAGAGQVILASCSNMVVEDQEISGVYMGIAVAFGSGNTIRRNVVSGGYYGVYVYSSGAGTVSGNSISAWWYGAYVYSSGGPTVSGNTVSVSGSSAYGIYLSSSSSATVSGNAMSGGSYGVYASSLGGITVSGNTVSVSGSNARAIHLSSSSSAALSGNAMNGGGVFIEGTSSTYWNTHTIDATNTVNGKPVRYCRNASGGTIPTGAGQVILASCSNMVVEDQEIRDVYMGIAVVFGSGNTIRGNAVSSGFYGIYLYSSGSNTINCNAVKSLSYGLYLSSSSGSTIHHNNVMYASLYSSGSTNTWNNPDGQGNFWSYYNGLDNGAGGRTAGDGIGDTNLPHAGVDYYPLMRGASCAHNFPPEISSFTATSKPEGTPVPYQASAADPEKHDLIYSFDFEGDGTYDQTGPADSASHAFPDDFTGTARLQVSDGVYTAEKTTSVLVTNAAPTVSLVRSPPGTLNPSETPVTFTATFADAGVLDTHTATWTFDGTTYPGTLSETGGSGTVTDTFTFSTPVQQMTLRVTDDDGGSGQASNRAPTISSFAVSSSWPYEGQPVYYYAYIYDQEGNPIDYGLDFQGDGTIDVSGTGSQVQGSYVFRDDFSGNARLLAGDRLLTAEGTAPVSVANYPPWPYITRIAPLGDPENAVFRPASGVLAQLELNGNTLDSSGNGRHATLLGGEFVPTQFGQGLHVYLGFDPSTYEVLPMGIDWSAYAQEFGHPYTIEFVLTPGGDWWSYYAKLFSFDDAADEGWYLTPSCSFVAWPNPEVYHWALCPWKRTYLALVSTSQNQMDIYVDGLLVGSSPSGLPTNLDEAIFFRDDSATSRYEQVDAVVDAMRISSVARSPEEILAIQQRLQGVAPPVPVGTTVSFAGAFWDPGLDDTHTATWTFDGITIPGTVWENGGSGTVTGSYTFTAPGVYEVTLTVRDDDGGEGTSAWMGGVTALVVVYDPSGDFVTGGGWIDSPPGSYDRDPDATGRASFGFVAKYLRGSSVPSGDTEFRFQAGDLFFHSTSYQWLVCGGAKCRFKGWGVLTVGQGTSAYDVQVGFMITAVDGSLPGGGGVDKFRIKIWDAYSEGYVIYDNMRGWPDDEEPPGIGGGSIVIHKG